MRLYPLFAYQLSTSHHVTPMTCQRIPPEILHPARRTKYDPPLRRRGDDPATVSPLKTGGREAYAAAMASAVRDYIEGAEALPAIERRHGLAKNALRHALERGCGDVRSRCPSDRLGRAASEYARHGGRPEKIALRWGVVESEMVGRGLKLRDELNS